MEDLISVIVPVYNIENYIDRCVESIAKQSYKKLEIILVDDGSTDGSGIICQKWKEKDDRVKVVYKDNGGLSDARNAGMRIATGQYYTFIDGDDEISPIMLERLFTELLSSKSDIAMCRMEKIEKNRTYATRKFPTNDNQLELSGKEAARLLFRDIIDCSMCLKLCKKELFNGILFPYGKTNEDFAIMYKLFCKSDRVIYIEDILYHYYYRDNSITTSAFSGKQFDKLDNCLEMVEFISLMIPELQLEARYYLYRQSMYLLKSLCITKGTRTYKQRYIQLKRILRKGTFDIINNKNISVKERGMYIFIAWFPRLYTMRKYHIRTISS